MKRFLQKNREKILQLAYKHGASDVRVFDNPNPDHQNQIGFLVNLDQGRTLLDQGGLLMDLQELLNCEVYVFTEKGLKDDYRKRILKQAVVL
ncbi:MAG: hypothetical protein BWK80_43490 [Desulfobacteraceae bacterium IS3]|nr:MAG: hypothetical protein BWK80_43490 [Desulfobacteraceae bacterium IS3]HAO20951.1 nucleotidyltransferase [Desulfobacteraceae bacterium]